MCIRLLLHYNSCISGFVPENTKWGWVSMSWKMIYDLWPSIYKKRSDSALQLHYEGYKRTIPSYGKEEKAFNFESKVTLEKLLHIEFASLCPSSLNTVLNPLSPSLLLREPHYLSHSILPLVEEWSGGGPIGRNLVSWFQIVPTWNSIMFSLLLIIY